MINLKEAEDTLINQDDELVLDNSYFDNFSDLVDYDEQAEAVRNFFKKVLGFSDAELQKIEPILSLVVSEAAEVGLSESKLPLLKFLKNFYKQGKSFNSIKEYEILHNLYSNYDIEDEKELSRVTDNILYNPNLYKMSYNDAREIYKIFNSLNKSNGLAKVDKTIKIDNQEYNLKNISALRNALIFVGNNPIVDSSEIRPASTIRNNLDKIYSAVGISQDTNIDQYKNFINYLKSVGFDPDNSQKLNLLYHAIYDLYKDEINNSKELLDLYKNIVNTHEEFKAKHTTELAPIIKLLSEPDCPLKAENLALIIAGVKKAKAPEKAAVTKSKSDKKAITKSKLDNLISWFNNKLDKTPGKGSKNYWKYLIMTLEDEYNKSGNKLQDDPEFYSKYVEGAKIPEDKQNKAIKDYFDNVEYLHNKKYINKDAIKELIKYAYNTWRYI